MSAPIACDGRNGRCTALAARIEGDCIAIVHKHHGEKHVTRIPIEALYLQHERAETDILVR